MTFPNFQLGLLVLLCCSLLIYLPMNISLADDGSDILGFSTKVWNISESHRKLNKITSSDNVFWPGSSPASELLSAPSGCRRNPTSSLLSAKYTSWYFFSSSATGSFWAVCQFALYTPASPLSQLWNSINELLQWCLVSYLLGEFASFHSFHDFLIKFNSNLINV